MSTMVALVMLLASLFAQADTDLTAYIEQFKAEAHAIAVANCGKPYFGTWCS